MGVTALLLLVLIVVARLALGRKGSASRLMGRGCGCMGTGCVLLVVGILVSVALLVYLVGSA